MRAFSRIFAPSFGSTTFIPWKGGMVFQGRDLMKGSSGYLLSTKKSFL